MKQRNNEPLFEKTNKQTNKQNNRRVAEELKNCVGKETSKCVEHTLSILLCY